MAFVDKNDQPSLGNWGNQFMVNINESLTKNDASGTFRIDECKLNVCNRDPIRTMSDFSDAVIEPFIVFSDTVIREGGTGKLSFIGTFDQWNSPNFPFRAPAFVVTVRLTNLVGQLSKVRVTFRAEERGTGHVIASAGAEINSEREFSRSDAIELPIKIPTIQFQHSGEYELVVLVNNEPLGKRVFKVNALTQGTTQTDIKEDT